jgi:hypothetical protein
MKQITRDEAFKEVEGRFPLTHNELKEFSKRFNNKRDIIIARQVGLGDSIISRADRKYFICDFNL